jgi:hypothetical protein
MPDTAKKSQRPKRMNKASATKGTEAPLLGEAALKGTLAGFGVSPGAAGASVNGSGAASAPTEPPPKAVAQVLGEITWLMARDYSTSAKGPACHIARVGAPIGLVLCTSAIFSLGIINASHGGGAIESGSSIGTTDIDQIIRKDGYNPGSFPPNESSPMSTAIRAYLLERAKQGGVAAADAALSEAGATCRALTDHTRHCAITRFRILCSADVVGAHCERAEWVVSIAYARRGNRIQNVHVTYTTTGELIR